MKKIYLSILLLIALTFSSQTHATVFPVTVANFQFTPALVNASVGDTIVWSWVSGTHTTTSTSVPSGAMMWNNDINSTSPVFAYIVTEVGTYTYKCNIHSSMQGQIVVTSTGISNPPAFSTAFNVYSVNSDSYNISYSLQRSAKVDVAVFDVTGKKVLNLESSVLPAGDYNAIYAVNELQKGIYFVQLLIDNQRLTKRIIIQ
jgi:plastocyanin